jgi:gamma-glutamyltranspeptidase/glutathione hydrolase
LRDEETDTTHFSIVDAAGNIAEVTFTINDWFGAKVIAGDTGFFLNDEMDDFTAKPGTPNAYGLVQGARNAIEPGKRPLSSMTPTLVLKGGRPYLVVGSPGGSRITTIVENVIHNVIDYGMDVQTAANAPRFHMQWLPDRVDVEPGAFSANVRTELQKRGYSFREVRFWGSVQAVLIDPKTGMRYGGTDRRHPAGAAIGY